MRTILDTVEGHPINLLDDGTIQYTAAGRIDGDGSGGNSWHDPDFQDATSLKFKGVSLNAETENYIVAHPSIIKGVAPIVLGSQAFVTYKGKTVPAVVGDIGPHSRLGEMSIACAKALGIPESPLTGGVESGVSYEIQPGVPATANGKTYDLQAS